MQKKSLLVFFAMVSGLMAQSETGRAALEGTLSDPAGKSIASADIALRETQTGLQRTRKTNAEGAFRASAPGGALPHEGDFRRLWNRERDQYCPYRRRDEDSQHHAAGFERKFNKLQKAQCTCGRTAVDLKLTLFCQKGAASSGIGPNVGPAGRSTHSTRLPGCLRPGLGCRVVFSYVLALVRNGTCGLGDSLDIQ